MKKVFLWIMTHKIIMLVCVVIVGGVWFFLQKSDDDATDQPTRQVVTAESEDITVTVSGTGQVAAGSQVDLKPQVAGDGLDIIEISVSNDQAVKEGDLIALLDTTEIQKTIREMQLSLNSAEIQMKQTERQYDNQTKDDKYARQLQEITLDQRQIALSNAYDDLEDYYIRAPFDGIVTGLDFSAGDSISRDEVLASVITEDVIVEISLNEVDAAQVNVDDPVFLTFDALDGVTAQGSVTKVDTIGVVDAGVVTYDVEISFTSPSALLKPGMSATADIEIARATDVVTLPVDAVVINDDETFVWIVGTTDRVERTIVETGITDDVMIEIVNGVNVGDQIVIVGGSVSATTANNSEQDSDSGSILQMGPGRGMGGGRPPE